CQSGNGADGGVIARRQHVGFTIEAREPRRVACESFEEELQRDIAVQTRVAGAIDFGHPAGTQQCGDFVRAEQCSLGKRHRRSRYAAQYTIYGRVTWLNYARSIDVLHQDFGWIVGCSEGARTGIL